MQDRGLAAYIAELIGTLILTFAICTVVVLYVATSATAQTGSAVPSCWAKRLTRSSSSNQRARMIGALSTAGASIGSGRIPPEASYRAVAFCTSVIQARSRAGASGNFCIRCSTPVKYRG